MSDKSWGIKERIKNGRLAPNVIHLEIGDEVIFYLCGEEGHCFIGTAQLKTGYPFVELVVHEEHLDWKYGVKLANIQLWRQHVPIETFRGVVSFVPEGKNYGSYIQGAITRMSDTEFNAITRNRT